MAVTIYARVKLQGRIWSGISGVAEGVLPITSALPVSDRQKERQKEKTAITS